MQKYVKNNKGFTLVEVIVVAVIVLILAAVAIPLYQGYIRDSRQAVAENSAGSIASALSAAIQIGAIVPDASAIPAPGTSAGGIRARLIGTAGSSDAQVAVDIMKNNTDDGLLTTVMIPKNYHVNISAEEVTVWWNSAVNVTATAEATLPTGDGDAPKTIGKSRFRNTTP
ncbi:MAG: prepilin-type N-terminal cleavage/methylation domain-containing protein [Chitinispirillia bacterium]|nr:prepilin-type N-terminal cleavage/methylation domain-containing protein [Chitinispirillia bacterium]